MLPTLSRQFTALERQRQAFLTGVLSMDSARRQFRPSASQWCAVEVVEHLVKTEQGILKEMQAAFSDHGNAGTVPVSDQVRGWLLTCLFRTPLRVRVPPTATAVLPARSIGILPAPIEQLTAQWQATRDELADLLERVPPSALGIGVFRHPVSGWMTLPRTLHFFSAHMQHHGYQLQRLQAAGRSAGWQVAG